MMKGSFSCGFGVYTETPVCVENGKGHLVKREAVVKSQLKATLSMPSSVAPAVLTSDGSGRAFGMAVADAWALEGGAEVGPADVVVTGVSLASPPPGRRLQPAERSVVAEADFYVRVEGKNAAGIMGDINGDLFAGRVGAALPGRVLASAGVGIKVVSIERSLDAVEAVVTVVVKSESESTERSWPLVIAGVVLGVLVGSLIGGGLYLWCHRRQVQKTQKKVATEQQLAIVPVSPSSRCDEVVPFHAGPESPPVVVAAPSHRKAVIPLRDGNHITR